MKIILDINVLMDVFERCQPHYDASVKVLSRSVKGIYKALVPGHAFTTIHYLIVRSGERSEALAAIRWLLDKTEVARVDAEVLERAYSLEFSDFEDAVVAAMAESTKCDYVVTRDEHDFATSPVPAISPSALLLMNSGG